MSSRTVAGFYVLFASIGVLILAWLMPPFQNPDEPNHMYRADQISHFDLLVEKLPDGEHGGWIEAGIPQANAPFAKIRFDETRKVTRPMYAPRPWGPRIPVGFPNTGLYPPTFYIPAAMAISLARLMHLTVLHGLLAARLFDGIVSIAVGGIGIALADAAAPWLFALLLLPMSLSLTAAVSQDGLLFACAALASSLCSRLRQPAGGASWIAAAMALALVGMARPPYAAVSLVLLAMRLPWRRRLYAFAIAVIPAIAWSALCAPHVVTPVFPGGRVDPATQLRFLLHGPWHIIRLVYTTLRVSGLWLLHGFIGLPGWLDVNLPEPYHLAAWIMLGVAAWISFGASDIRNASIIGLSGVAIAALAVFLLLYLTWSLPGAAVIDGVQGRYFIPLAIMLAASRAPGNHAPAGEAGGIFRPLYWSVVVFPIVSITVLTHAIAIRYYP